MIYRPSIHGERLVKSPTPPKGLGGNGYSPRTYYDGFRRKLIPDDAQLIRENKRVIYTCCQLNVNRVVSTPLRLYMKREVSGQKTLLRKGIETKQISHRQKDYLSGLQPLQKTLRRFVDIEEVVVHPILDLLQKGNRLPFFNGQRLQEIGQWYQEIVGREYWLIENHPILGIPTDIWLLPSHYVTPHVSETRKIIDYYEVKAPGTLQGRKYKPEDVLSYLMPSLNNPYLEGYSPLMAAYDMNDVASKQLSLEANLLDNEGRPDIILTPKQDSTIGEDEAERFETQYRARFARGRTGGMWVMPEAMELLQLNFNPKDLARLDLHKVSKNEIANCYGVPYAMISDASHNREQLEACETQHAKHAIVPRLNRRTAVYNDPSHGLVSRFDDSGVLFLAYDNPIPENEEQKTLKMRAMVQDGIWTRNEARKYDGTYGESDDEIADKLLPMNVPSEAERSNSRGIENKNGSK